jgi:hypothetical protein
MWPRCWFLCITLFFVTMNVLVWRSEFGGRSTLGSTVRPEVVLARMLESSDTSDLEIRHRNQKIGRCRWTPTVVERFQAEPDDQALPEGMVREVTGYSVDLDGSFAVKDLPRIRFNFHLNLDTNHAWTDLQSRLLVNLRGERQPLQFEARASAAQDNLTLSPPLFTEGDGHPEEVIPLAALRNPDKLLQQLGGPALPAALAALGIPLQQLPAGTRSATLEWQALKGHRIPLGRSMIPVYCLRTRLFDRYPITLYVTESGEIFRGELANEVTLVNEKLLTF